MESLERERVVFDTTPQIKRQLRILMAINDFASIGALLLDAMARQYPELVPLIKESSNDTDESTLVEIDDEPRG